jgi:uncharacterized phage protein gp47/JayE
MISEIAALLWEVGDALNAARDPDKATGSQLESLCLITGTFRTQASFSAVTLTLTGTPTSPVPAGKLASVVSTGRQFKTIEDSEIVAVAAWQPGHTYVTDDRVANGAGDGNVYLAVIGGVSAGSGGPLGQVVDELDNTVHWRWLGAGAGAVDTPGQAVDVGAVIAASGTITNIVTHVGGWLGVTNILDASTGNDRMTDEQLRVLRELELAKPGTSPADAIRADILEVPGVQACTVFVNNSDLVDADGRPPHSVECLIDGGGDQAIFDQLLQSVAAGIRTFGNVTGTSVDANGTAQPMAFSRVTAIPIYVAINLSKVPNDADNPNSYPADGDAEVAIAVATSANAGGNGRNAVASALVAPAFAVVGVVDVTQVLIGIAPSPSSSATITISKRERAVYDSSRVAVTSVDGDF